MRAKKGAHYGAVEFTVQAYGPATVRIKLHSQPWDATGPEILWRRKTPAKRGSFKNVCRALPRFASVCSSRGGTRTHTGVTPHRILSLAARSGKGRGARDFRRLFSIEVPTVVTLALQPSAPAGDTLHRTPNVHAIGWAMVAIISFQSTEVD
jgi:hypothetical protein